MYLMVLTGGKHLQYNKIVRQNRECKIEIHGAFTAVIKLQKDGHKTISTQDVVTQLEKVLASIDKVGFVFMWTRM